MTTGILQKKQSDTVKFKVSISRSLHEKLTELEERIKREAPDSFLNTDEIVEKALASAVKKATKELDGKNDVMS